MTITNATLKINESEYDILNFKYGFQRDIDTKGRPWGVYYGGSIVVQMESSDNISSFRQMIDKKMAPVKGSIEVFSEDGYCFRRIGFEKAYVTSLGEDMYGNSPIPMITTIEISPMRLDFNDTLCLDRHWPEAPHGWQKYEAKEEKYAKANTAPNVMIKDAYWIDEEKKERRDLITNNEVTLYVVIEGGEVGQQISLAFEDQDDMGAYRADCSGTIKEEELLIIENFKMKQTKKGEE